jgi:hypothetical protein
VPSITRSSVVLLGLAVLLLAGCGSKKTAKDRYVASLNAMCANFAAREQKIGSPSSPSDVAVRGDRIVIAFEETIMRPLQALPAPPELRLPAQRLRTLSVQQRDVLRELADAAKAGDVARLQVLAQRNRTLNAELGQVAGDLKADSCAS